MASILKCADIVKKEIKEWLCYIGRNRFTKNINLIQNRILKQNFQWLHYITMVRWVFNSKRAHFIHVDWMPTLRGEEKWDSGYSISIKKSNG